MKEVLKRSRYDIQRHIHTAIVSINLNIEILRRIMTEKLGKLNKVEKRNSTVVEIRDKRLKLRQTH